jgi:hypothetical protein
MQESCRRGHQLQGEEAICILLANSYQFSGSEVTVTLHILTYKATVISITNAA